VVVRVAVALGATEPLVEQEQQIKVLKVDLLEVNGAQEKSLAEVEVELDKLAQIVRKEVL
jgi:hypothetical protein